MTRIRRIALGVLGVIVAAALHWTLPSREVVRIVNTEIVRRETAERTAAGQTVMRGVDVRYIHAVTPSGRPRVFRNEDTGWGWPPYFKFNSANLAVRAEEARSTADAPRWMVVTSYGWRLELLSAFPNAVALRPAEGPDERLFPWVNLIVLAALAAAALALRARLRALFRRG